MITAVVLDGFHKGHVVRMDYHPTIKLLKPKVQTIDYCCGGDDIGMPTLDEIVEYKECFRGVDTDVVLYSTKGASTDFLGWFGWQRSDKPWTPQTLLYMGYHDEPILRKDDGTEVSQYEKGYELGVEDGRIMQAKSRNNF